jgi:hypothetical protein
MSLLLRHATNLPGMRSRSDTVDSLPSLTYVEQAQAPETLAKI